MAPETSTASGRRRGSGSLPDELTERFDVVEAWSTRGAQAEMFLVNDPLANRRRVVKVYHHGIELATEVASALVQDESRHVVRHFEVEQLRDRRWFQVLEYVPHGTLRDLMPNDRQWNDSSATVILTELVKAVEHVHQVLGLTHRDIKPANVMVVSRSPLQLVLIDFGITQTQTLTTEFGDRRMTLRYAPPEASLNLTGHFQDWWSVGMIMAEGVGGRHPFDDVDDMTIPALLHQDSVDLSAVRDHWQPLCRGLLVRDRQQRWTADHVRRWLRNEEVSVPNDRFGATGHPFAFNGVEYMTRESLAEAITILPARVIDQSLVREIAAWLRYSMGSTEAAEAMELIATIKQITSEERQLRLQMVLDPLRVPTYGGVRLSIPGGLADFANAAIQGTPWGGTEARKLMTTRGIELLGFLGDSAADKRYATINTRWLGWLDGYQNVIRLMREMDAPNPTPDIQPLVAAHLLAVSVAEVAYGELGRRELAERARAEGIVDGRVKRAALLERLAVMPLRRAVVEHSDATAAMTDWYRHLGDPKTASADRLVAMLGYASLASESARRSGRTPNVGSSEIARVAADRSWTHDHRSSIETVIDDLLLGRVDPAMRRFERVIDAALSELDTNRLDGVTRFLRRIGL